MTVTTDTPRGLHITKAWLQQIHDLGIEPDQSTVERIRDLCFRNRRCRDCGAGVGRPHDHGCDIERCMRTGEQWIACGGQGDWHSCDCEDDNGYDPDGYTIHTCGQVAHDCGSQVWDGVWPGYEEAVELGVYCRWTDGEGWHVCGPEHPDAQPDLTFTMQATVWDRVLGRNVPQEWTQGMIARRATMAA